MNRSEKRLQQKLAQKKAKSTRLVQSTSSSQTLQKRVIQQTLELALQHHSAGDWHKAESIYQQILQTDPNQPDALHLIGVLAHQVGKNDIAFDFITKAIAIKPDYFEAHSNLGNTLFGLGKFDEAVASFKKALAIMPDYIEAHSNLGNALRELGKFDEAVDSYNEALAIKPDYVEAHSNLGNALRFLGRIDEAVASYKNALAIKPDYTEVQVSLAICAWVQNQQSECKIILQQINPKKLLGTNSLYVSYYTLLQKLTGYYAENPGEYEQIKTVPPIFAIGESHCISPAHSIVSFHGTQHRIFPKLIMGCRAWHLGNTHNNKFKAQFERIVCSLSSGQTAVLMFGEIDCRPNGDGILSHHKETGDDLSKFINELVYSYVEYVVNSLGSRGVIPVFYGVPARMIRRDSQSLDDEMILSFIINAFNQALASETAKRNIAFLDVFSLTNDANSQSSGKFHIDSIHVLPTVFGDLTKQI